MYFKTVNNTDYNFWEVDFIILLFSRNRIVGVNKYVLDKFLSGQTRQISATWPGKLSGAINYAAVNPEVNVMRPDIYMEYDGGVGEKK